MKKRVSIYIDDGAWENLKEHAWLARKSASAYLEDLICGEVPFKEHVEALEENEELKSTVSEVSVDLAAANAKLKSKPIMSYTKDRQLGKKGAG